MQILLLFVSAFPSLVVAVEQDWLCIPRYSCDINPNQMLQAINLIPTGSGSDPGAYRVPAIFEVSQNAQISVRVTSAAGLTLDGDTLMTHLWPHAQRTAMVLFDHCNMRSGECSGKTNPTLRWNDGRSSYQLGYEIQLDCNMDKSGLRGATTYTPSGIRSGLSIGAGRPITGWGSSG